MCVGVGVGNVCTHACECTSTYMCTQRPMLGVLTVAPHLITLTLDLYLNVELQALARQPTSPSMYSTQALSAGFIFEVEYFRESFTKLKCIIFCHSQQGIHLVVPWCSLFHFEKVPKHALLRRRWDLDSRSRKEFHTEAKLVFTNGRPAVHADVVGLEGPRSSFLLKGMNQTRDRHWADVYSAKRRKWS